MTPEWVFVPGWKSRSGTRTGVNSRRYDSRRYDILCWYHVNEYRAIRENRSELAPGWKSPRYHVNTPLVKYKIWKRRQTKTHLVDPMETIGLMVAPWKYEVAYLICPRIFPSRANICSKNIIFPRGNYQPIVPRQKHSIVKNRKVSSVARERLWW